jgi:DNA-binding NarL/FixJ family response regulator
MAAQRGVPRGRESAARPAGMHPEDEPPGRSLTVLVAIRHPAMRRYTCEILERDCACSIVAELDGEEMLADALARSRPDLVLIDTGEFPRCCTPALATYPTERVIVVGPEPEGDYRTAALTRGAGAWIPRDRLAEELQREVRRLSRGPRAGAPNPYPPGDPTVASELDGSWSSRPG